MVRDNLTMIAAIGRNNEIGKNGKLIWRFKEDLNTFKDYTMGKPMVMGFNTFYSLRGGKPLPLRKHIVLTKNRENELNITDQIMIVSSINELLEYVDKYKDEIMVIGGASVYTSLLNYAKKLILTEINAEDKGADAYFPGINESEWNGEIIYTNEENGVSYSRKIYIRK